MGQITDFLSLKDKNDMIVEFQNEYRWLSNFMPAIIVLEGITYPSVEHAYVSAKSDTKEWKAHCSRTDISAAQIKRDGRELNPSNWNEIKMGVMEECLRQKYNQEPYKTKLIETGSRYIQEGNRWGDKYWGVCLKTNEGDNNLGKRIMICRDVLQSQCLTNDEQTN